MRNRSRLLSLGGWAVGCVLIELLAWPLVVELVEPEESEEEMAARDAAIRESFTEALDWLCRTRDGEVGRFRPGFSALAVRTKSAILPVAVEGAFDPVVVAVADDLNMPVVVNISLGGNWGPHVGNMPQDLFIDNELNDTDERVVVGTSGNDNLLGDPAGKRGRNAEIFPGQPGQFFVLPQ